MSNYLVVVSKGADVAARLDRWLGVPAGRPVSDHLTVDLGGDTRLTYVAEDAASDRAADVDLIFRGYQVRHASREIVFGLGGLQDAEAGGQHPRRAIEHARAEGCYLRVQWDAERVTVERDLFGLLPLLRTTGPGFVALSDSLYALSRLRRELGLTLTRSRTAAVARSWSNGMAGQLLSPRTVVREVDYVPFTASVEVRTADLATARVDSRVDALFPAHDVDYATGLRDAARALTGTLAGLAHAVPHGLRLSLSGGLDSRVVLAACLRIPEHRDVMEYTCANRTEPQQRDYRVVEQLAASRDFTLGTKAPTPRLGHGPEHGLAPWVASSVGLYDYVLFPGRVDLAKAPVVIGGHGAEVYKGNYGWRRLSAIARHIEDTEVRSAFLEEVRDGVHALGVAADATDGSEWHYLGYRNSLHAGRFVQKSLLGCRPLAMASLVSLSRAENNPHPRPHKYEPSLVTDLLVAIDPALASLPYDSEAKTLRADYVDARRRALGVEEPGVIDAEPYRAVGDPADAQRGPCAFLVGLASDVGTALADANTRTELVRDTFDSRLDNHLRSLYQPFLETLLAPESRLTPAGSTVGAAVGKIAQFVCLE